MSGVAGKPPCQFVWIWRSYWSWWKEECPSWISTNWNEGWDWNNTAHRLPLVIHLRRWWDDHSVCSNQAVRHPWRSWRLQRSVKRVVGGGGGQWGGGWGKTNHTPMNRELKQQRFWGTHVNRKWPFFIFWRWFRANFQSNRLYNSKETKEYKFYIIKACEEGNYLTSGWRASLKNVVAA